MPTNATEFIKILEPNKINFLLWHYTSFLWIDYPSLNGYFTDHFSFGPIDYMIEMWNIENIFCHSPEIMVTWNYISKLKDKIDINYILMNLNMNNNLFYIKPNAKANHAFGFNRNRTFSKSLPGRYESVFQTMPEYTKSPEETKKFLNNNYLNFLKYFRPLPKITIFNSNNKIVENIIYPENKIEIVSENDKITGDYVILSENILNSATILIEYFNKKNIYYSNTYTSCPDPGNDRVSKLLTKEEFLND